MLTLLDLTTKIDELIKTSLELRDIVPKIEGSVFDNISNNYYGVKKYKKITGLESSNIISREVDRLIVLSGHTQVDKDDLDANAHLYLDNILDKINNESQNTDWWYNDFIKESKLPKEIGDALITIVSDSNQSIIEEYEFAIELYKFAKKIQNYGTK